MKKTIIQVWTHDCKNYKSTEYYARWGLGDIVRGSIGLYQLCKKYRYEFICDIQLHPTSLCLEVTKHSYSDLVLKNKKNINFVPPNQIEQYITSTNNEGITLLMTNAHLIHEITDECKDYFRNLFKPNFHFQQHIAEKQQCIPHPTFNVMHYRVAGISGDHETFHKSKKNYQTLLEHIQKFKQNNDILITDSLELKTLAKEILFTFDTKIAHLGFHTDYESVRDTLLEFFIMTHANKIKYHPANGPSGFIKIINYIFNVPLEKME